MSDRYTVENARKQEELLQRRIGAAAASGGTSPDEVVKRFEELILRAGVAGDALDFGAGTGRLTSWLCSAGFARIVGADLLQRPADLPTDGMWITADLNGKLPLEDEAFDLVVAAEVIEHLENPRAVAREWYRLLRPGGALILSTPNNESLRSLLSLLCYGQYVAFRDSTYPAHITPLLRTDVRRSLMEAGFEPPRFHFGNGCIPLLTELTWQRVSFGVLSGVRFSDTMFVVARRP